MFMISMPAHKRIGADNIRHRRTHYKQDDISRGLLPGVRIAMMYGIHIPVDIP